MTTLPTINPVQTTSYVLDIELSSLTFGAATNISAASGDGVWGKNEAMSWIVNTQGSVTGVTGVELDFISAYTNTGTVTGTANAGVSMTGGGLFTNKGSIHETGAGGWGATMGNTGGGYGAIDNTFANHGLIDGAYGGVQLAGSTAARNSGTISGGSIGLAMNGGGSLTNTGKIISAGQTGAYFGAAATVTDKGVITGAANAVQFAGSGANSLTLYPSAKLTGDIVGSTASGATTALTLMPQAIGTINGSLQHITSVNDTGGTWVLNGHSNLPSVAIQSGAVLQVGDKTHAGGDLTITALQNAGTVKVYSGALDIHGVTGAGSMFILGGSLELGSNTQGPVSFSGTAGLLQLDHSAGFNGAVGGFNLSGSALDLHDVAFVSPSEASFSGTSSSGTLTVTDGTHTAHIALTGALTSATFTAESDGHGGTLVYDPVASTNSALADLIHHSLGVTII